VWGAGFHLPAGGKTGTTNDGTNVWFIGYTADLLAGVWIGFDKPRKIMADAQGGRLAAPAWTQFMTEVYRRRPAPPDWPRPQAIITREIDFTTGLLQTPYCPRDVVGTEFYIPGTEPTHECDKHLGYQTPGYDSLGMAIPPAYPPPAGYNPSTSINQPRITPGATPTPRRSAPDTSRRVRPDTMRNRTDSLQTGDSLSAPRAR
jgi:Membrane carboxypeptidase/penicillin-binding protein